jgi:hypothetical protein
MFDEFQNGTNTVMNIKCDFVGCENQDSVFCATREKANNTLFERGWIRASGNTSAKITPPNTACTRRAEAWRKKYHPNQKGLRSSRAGNANR